MVERGRSLRAGRRLGVALVAAGLAGCGLVPRARLEDCRRLARGLQSENAQLKDAAISLRARNDDLAERAVDDARRLDDLQEANRRLEQSVVAYQEERERYARAFDDLKRRLQLASDAVPTALQGRLEDFVRDHPGWAFDPEAGALTVSTAALFAPGTADLRPGADDVLRDVAAALAGPEAEAPGLLIVGRSPGTAVLRAGLRPDAGRPGRLGIERAIRVRDRLCEATGLRAAGVGVAEVEAPPDSHLASVSKIEIRLRCRAQTEGSSSPP